MVKRKIIKLEKINTSIHYANCKLWLVEEKRISFFCISCSTERNLTLQLGRKKGRKYILHKMRALAGIYSSLNSAFI